MSLEYEYQPTDLEDELFLSEIPVELLQSSIKTQFDDPLEYRKKDYVQSFIMKYEFSKDNMLEDDLAMLEVTRDNFLIFMEKIFQEKLSVGFVNLDDMGDEDQHELIHLTYRFFLKNIKKNFVNIITNIIENNTDEISARYDKKKDVTSVSFKTEIDNEYDILVLSNLGSIIKDSLDDLSNSDDVDTFFKLCEGDEPSLELEYVQNAYNEFELSGNFIKLYCDMLDTDFISEIQSKVRNRILKKYPKRSKRADVQEEEYDINSDTEKDNVPEETED